MRHNDLPPRRAISFTQRVSLGRQVSSAVCGAVRDYCKLHDVSLTFVLTKSGVTRQTFKRWEEDQVRLSQIPTALAMLAVLRKRLVVEDE